MFSFGQSKTEVSSAPGEDKAPRTPQIITPLPGPKAQAIIAKDEQYISPSYTRGYPLVMAKGEGAMVQDVDGNWFLDFCSGIAVCSTGHSNEAVRAAIHAQVDRFLHMSGTDFYYEVMADLAQKLDETSPGTTPKKVFLCNSGAEAIEGALKLARFATGRPSIISFYRSFHGRTFGAMSVSTSKVTHRTSFSPLLGQVYHAHYPYPYRPFFGNTDPEAEAEACLDFIRKYLFKMVVNPSDTAAILVESIQGEGGYVVPPRNWLPGLRALCDEHGILLICDEVQSGVGRTGKMWACEHDGIEPDIIASAKGIASGLPLGAIIAKGHLMTWPPGAHATTFGGNPVACAAALATIDQIEQCLMLNASEMGARFLEKLHALVEEFDCLGEARGRGLMLGLEVVKSKACRTPDYDKRNWIVDTAFEHGLMILGCGENTIRFCPPLMIDAHDIDTAIDILRTVLQKR